MMKPLMMQGKIGYWVDGELKFMPPKRNPWNHVTKNVTNNVRTYQNVKVEPTHVTRTWLCNTYLEQNFVILQDLKNASKIGSLDGVLKVIQNYFFSWYKRLSTSDRFSELTRLLLFQI
eukprot:scaffold4796_cov57-Attheya_sp.AAC.1